MATTDLDLTASDNERVEQARKILRRLFRHFDGSGSIRLWDGSEVGLGNGAPEFALILHTPSAFRDIVLSRNPLRLAELYFQGEIDLEGDLYGAIQIRYHLTGLHLSLAEKVALGAKALAIGSGSSRPNAVAPRWHDTLAQRLGLRSSKELNRHSIAFHYDVSDEFYRLWLDENMVYSCAYFEERGQSLEQAQRNKLDHICRKLRLQPGERLLDIGCGWGALLCWAAEHYGVSAHGITLSENQHRHVQQLIESRGLSRQVSVELLDYRDLKGDGGFDKVVSVGMFEHVGLKNLPAYFAIARQMLKPGGLFLNHGITSDEGGWKKSVATEFINRYVFPDGQVETVSTVQRVMEDSGFEIHDVEGLRPHYALTLREWVRRLESQREEALQHVSEATYRVWRLYMSVCAIQFELGVSGVYQILASRRAPYANPVPLTRRDLYQQARS